MATNYGGTDNKSFKNDNAPRHLPSQQPTTPPTVSGSPHPAGARLKVLTRPPKLESVTEDDLKNDKPSAVTPSSSSEFGVRSYLHQFYEEDPSVKDTKNELYESGGGPMGGCKERVNRCIGRRYCSPFWWKAGTWVGVNVLVLGLLALSVSYIVKPHSEIMDYKDKIPVIDKEAVEFNRKLNSAKLVSLVLLCIGGLLVTISLLFPSLGLTADPDEFHVDPSGTFPPYMPLETQDDENEEGIPYTSKLTNVQPIRAKGESVVAGSGMVGVED